MTSIYTADLSPMFDARVFSLAVAVKAEAQDIVGVWYSESGCHAGAHNPNGDAAGLCQLMPQSLKNLGYLDGWEEFIKLNAADQVPWCERYYRPYTGKMLSPELAYLATFLPAYLDQGFLKANGITQLADDTVIAAKGGRLGWAYSANAVFDENNDGKIVLSELADAIKRNFVGPRADEIRARIALVEGKPVPDPTVIPSSIDLGTVWGAQKALKLLLRPDGTPWYTGTVDGLVGPLMRKAIMDYQLQHGLEQVGYVGPKTKADIQQELGTT